MDGMRSDVGADIKEAFAASGVHAEQFKFLGFVEFTSRQVVLDIVIAAIEQKSESPPETTDNRENGGLR
jgi:hypothetical protein